MQPVPIGVTGELHIGGDGLARGYLDHPRLTAERFVPDPFGGEPGGRIYKTGDLTRWLPDRQIEFVGRNDFQIKVRGFRVELGEIETMLRAHEAVREAVVVARTDARGDVYLTAYVVAACGPLPASGELRAFLKKKLPEYMLPSVYLGLDKLPLTPHGKVDRRALPRSEGAMHALDAPFVAPDNAIEEVLAEIFAEVMKVERVGVNDNFFDLGGHSLLAAQLISRVRKDFQPDLPLRKSLKRPQSRRSPRCSLPASRVQVSLRRRRRHCEASRVSRQTIWKSCSEEKRRKRLAEPQRGAKRRRRLET
jgi:acyl carrier protein